MKDSLLKAVKGAYGLLPEKSKTRLRRYHNLREWYGNKLRQSSIAYEVPPLRKIRRLHQLHLLSQKERLASPGSGQQTINVLVIGDKGYAETVKSLNRLNTNINTVYIDHAVCREGLHTALPVESRSAIDMGTYPLLVLQAGVMIYEDVLTASLNNTAAADITYFDAFTVNDQNKLQTYEFLPDWNPDLLLATGYIASAVLLKSDSTLNTFFVKENHIESALADAYLSGTDFTVNHEPLSFTYSHTRKANLDNLKSAIDRHHLQAENLTGKVLAVQWPLLSRPLVSLVIPTYNGKALVKACIDSILEKTTYQNYEILLVDNNSDEPASLEFFEQLNQHPRIRLLKYPHPFNYSAINNFAVKQAKGEIVGLVNNDIEVISPHWLEYMAAHAVREDIGCVGAKLLYTDGRIQHAGVVLGYGGGAGHAHKYFPRYHPGYMNRLLATQNYSAVTAACLLVKKSKYEEVGGLNEKELHVAFNDVDFCLRVAQSGVRNLYCAEAELFHHESVSRGLDITPEKAARFNKELNYLKTTWGHYIDHDPAYNPNLTLKRENFAIKAKEEY
ncbi:glycosyltransferase family 2 protein [Salinimonas marina]|uniref:Glycosyltransferase family 2 protein n=1 Tax=Salinimonas marina TaxID=2785918 RepID=A0A7S9DXW8_9ALTE|nr:glycosyltransferase family 2 protein [Salinimonas marina]QPG06027.1 glycosyltransferase family 2 protein [Salinimonas marina]